MIARNWSWAIFTDSTPDEPRPRLLANNSQADTPKAIYTDSLYVAVTEFLDILSEYGEVTRIEIITGPNTGRAGRNLRAWVDPV